jgi:hypothetical protein
MSIASWGLGLDVASGGSAVNSRDVAQAKPVRNTVTLNPTSVNPISQRNPTPVAAAPSSRQIVATRSSGQVSPERRHTVVATLRRRNITV